MAADRTFLRGPGMRAPPNSSSSAATDANALSAFRDAVKSEENLLILIGSELRPEGPLYSELATWTLT